MEKVTRIKTGGRQAGVQNKVSREVRQAAMLHADDALAALVTLMAEATNEQVRLGAARELLDRTCGRTADAVEVLRFETADQRIGKPPETLAEMLDSLT